MWKRQPHKQWRQQKLSIFDIFITSARRKRNGGSCKLQSSGQCLAFGHTINNSPVNQSIKLLKSSLSAKYHYVSTQSINEYNQKVNQTPNLASFTLLPHASSGFIRSLLRALIKKKNALLRTFKSSIDQSFICIKVEEETSSRHLFIEHAVFFFRLDFSKNQKLSFNQFL